MASIPLSQKVLWSRIERNVTNINEVFRCRFLHLLTSLSNEPITALSNSAVNQSELAEKPCNGGLSAGKSGTQFKTDFLSLLTGRGNNTFFLIGQSMSQEYLSNRKLNSTHYRLRKPVDNCFKVESVLKKWQVFFIECFSGFVLLRDDLTLGDFQGTFVKISRPRTHEFHGKIFTDSPKCCGKSFDSNFIGFFNITFKFQEFSGRKCKKENF